jgi:hypothetical protein
MPVQEVVESRVSVDDHVLLGCFGLDLAAPGPPPPRSPPPFYKSRGLVGFGLIDGVPC